MRYLALVGRVRVDSVDQLAADNRARSSLGHLGPDHLSHALAHTLLARVRRAHLDRLGMHLIPRYRLLASRHQRVLAQPMRLSRRHLLSRLLLARLLLYTSSHHDFRLRANLPSRHEANVRAQDRSEDECESGRWHGSHAQDTPRWLSCCRLERDASESDERWRIG